MGRVLKILMYLVLLFLVYLWLSTVFKSCNNGENNIITDATETLGGATDDIVDASQEIADEADEFFEDEDDVNYEELDAEEDWEDEDIYEDDVIETPAVKPASRPAAKPAPRPSAPARSSSAGGKYLVIAGSYMQKANAQSMKSKLSKLGHDAEIVNFDDSRIHVVTSGRYTSRSDADAVARQLNGKGIDNYVHRRK